jgi:hypothetical protein
MLLVGISFVIIEPAATTEFSPIIIGPNIFAPSAITTFLQIIGLQTFSHSLLLLLSQVTQERHYPPG